MRLGHRIIKDELRAYARGRGVAPQLRTIRAEQIREQPLTLRAEIRRYLRLSPRPELPDLFDTEPANRSSVPAVSPRPFKM